MPIAGPFRAGQKWWQAGKPSDLGDFVACYAAGNRSKRKETDRFKRFGVDELLKRDKLNLDIFWLKDEKPG
jgi:type I restriction enzyme M protein